jgi:hypothetical protein
MAAASLLIRLGVDLGNLKTGVSTATNELGKLGTSAKSVSAQLAGAFPNTLGPAIGKMTSGVASLSSAFGGLGLAVGGLTVGALVNDFLDTTSSLVDLSEQTAITIQDLQRFKFAGEQVGVGLESITTAVGQLQNRLGSGDKSAFAALDTLGITIQEIQRLDPGQQFEAIATSISNIADPSKRAAVAMDLFGRSGISLLPLLRSNLKEVGDQAGRLSDETVKAGDAAGDAFNTFMNWGKVAIGGGVLGPIIKGVGFIKEAYEDLKRTIETVTLTAEELPKAFGNVKLSGKGFEGPKLSFEEALKASDELDKQIEAQFHKRQTQAQKQVAQQKQIDAQIFAGLHARAALLKDTDDDLRQSTLALMDYVAANRVAAEVIPATIPADITERWRDWTDHVEEHFQTLKKLTNLQGGEFKAAQQETARIIDLAAGALERQSAAMQKGLNFGAQLSQNIIGAIQGGGDIGKSVGAFLGDKLGATLGKSLAKSIGSTFGATLGGMLGPLGAIGGSLLGGLFDKIFGGKSQRRKDVEAFADTFEGGFKGLQKRLSETFDANTADRYWRALTQGGGDAKVVIEGITAAFEKQDAILNQAAPTYADVTAAAARYGLEVDKIGDSINSLRVMETAQQAVADWELMAKAGADMSEVAAGMADEIQGLVIESVKWGHALPEAMRPILQKMIDMGLLTDDAGDKLIDLERIKFDKPLVQAIDGLIGKMDELIDKIENGLSGAIRNVPNLDFDVPHMASGGIVTKPTLALIGEAGPEAVVPLGGRGMGGTGGGPIVVQTFLDGYQIAEATVPHIPDVVRRRG